MTDHDERWVAVGDAIAARIKELGITKSALQKRAGVSDKTLTGYIEGRPIVRPDKAKALCTALLWPADAIDRLLRAEPPIPSPDDRQEGDSGQQALAHARVELDRSRVDMETLSGRVAELRSELEAVTSALEEATFRVHRAHEHYTMVREEIRKADPAMIRRRRLTAMADSIEGLPERQRDDVVSDLEKMLAQRIGDPQFAVAAEKGEQDTQVGPTQNRPSPEPEPEGP